MKRIQWNIDKVRDFAQSLGLDLISDNYINNKTKLKFSCKKHGIFETKLNTLTTTKRCPKCATEAVTEKRKIPIEKVRETAENMGYELVSQEYKNASSPIVVKCPKHGEFTTSYVKLYGNHRCYKCYHETRFLTFEAVKERIERAGYTCLEKEYINQHEPMKLYCKKHGEFTIPFQRITMDRGCPKCGHERQALSIRGENSKGWKGGVNTLSESLRNVLKPWIESQLKRANYKCEITGTSGVLNVHHMTPFYKIVDRTFKELGIDIRPHTSDYTDDEWLLISRTLIKNNEEMANPVVMREDIHREFHKFCGGQFQETSFEQLKDFKKLLLNTH